MKENTPFNSLLQALMMRSSTDLFSDGLQEIEASTVFGKTYQKQISTAKMETMIQSLVNELSKDTLGILVSKAMAEQNVISEQVLEQTGLTPNTLTDIREDAIFTNSIPVRSLAKLLKTLKISIKEALGAIDQTFEKLILEGQVMSQLSTSAKPIYRKGSLGKDYGFDISRFKSDGGYLFQNKEALEQYEQRLVQLYNEHKKQ